MALKSLLLRLAALILVAIYQPVIAEKSAPVVVEINFNHHRFIPEKIEISAGQSVVIRVVNASQERIEFESFKLNREKVVEPGRTVTVHLPALAPGSYDFFDDFHDDVPEGVIVAR
ncbi:MAG TPA: cupredoxin domain-containing protein [Opitutaceae bacterium]|nr:cupredoxin domain-containing protein [Opitutaceae bacterium]